VSGANQTTGADGVATVGSWTLGGTAGANTLRATVGVDGVTGNPVTFTATATGGAPDPGKSTVSAAPGTIAASQGSAQSTITVVVRDALGNSLAGRAVTLSATGAGVTIGQPGPSDASGTTTGTLSATGSGVHTVSAKVGGVTLGSVDVTVTAGPPDASRTSVSVPNGSAGTATEVNVSLQDQFGNPVGGAAGQIAVAVSGANTKDKLPVEDRGGGSYRATYTPVATGTDQITVRVGGAPVPGSPFTSTVVAGAAAPGRTTADVPSDGQFAQPLEIIVHVADALGNPLGRGGDQVTVLGGDGTTLNVEDRGDGTYRAVWVPFVSGRFKIAITLNGAPIKGSPYDTRIRFFN
jgi:adhesin/invasin